MRAPAGRPAYNRPPKIPTTTTTRLTCRRCGHQWWAQAVNVKRGEAPVCCPNRACKRRGWWMPPVYVEKAK